MAAPTRIIDNFAPNWLPYLDSDGGMLSGFVLDVHCDICSKGLVFDEREASDEFEACTILPCGHALGYECALMWLGRRGNAATCPFCRLRLSHTACGHRIVPALAAHGLRRVISDCEHGLSPVCLRCWRNAQRRRDRAPTEHRSRRNPILNNVCYWNRGPDGRRRANEESPPGSPLTALSDRLVAAATGDWTRSVSRGLRTLVEETLMPQVVGFDEVGVRERERLVAHLIALLMRENPCLCRHCSQLREDYPWEYVRISEGHPLDNVGDDDEEEEEEEEEE
ncbi:hypothetical protein F4861DRAFT_393138 [Xylaria intraflava]|nr:hypothetical protein F4861DRAFT_393138 [Xylaria intraflava]